MTVLTQPQPFACPACSATIFWPPLPAKQSSKKQKVEFWSDGYDPNAPTNLVDCPFCWSLFPRYFVTLRTQAVGVVPRLDYLTPVVAFRHSDNSDVASSVEQLARIPGYKSWRGAVYLGPRPLDDSDPIFLALCIESIVYSFNNRVRVKARTGQTKSSLSAESVMSNFLGSLITRVGFREPYENPQSNIFGMDMNNFMGDAKWCLILAEAARTVGLFHLSTEWAHRAIEILWRESPLSSENEIECKRAQVIAFLADKRNASQTLFEPDKVQLVPPRKKIPPRTFNDTEIILADTFGPAGAFEIVNDPSTMSPKEINLQVAAGKYDLVLREIAYREANPEVVQRLPREYTVILSLFDPESGEEFELDLRLLSDAEVIGHAHHYFDAVRELDFRGFTEDEIESVTEFGISMPLSSKVATYLFYDDMAQKILGACIFTAHGTFHTFQGWVSGGKGWTTPRHMSQFHELVFQFKRPGVSVWELGEEVQRGGDDEGFDINTYGSTALQSLRDDTGYPVESLEPSAYKFQTQHYWPHWFEPAFAI